LRIRQQIQHDDRGLADANGRIEDVTEDERHPIGDARGLRGGVGLRDPLRVDVDADAARAKLLGGGNDDLPVTATEVIDDIVFRDFGEGEHAGDDGVAGRNPDDVGRAGGLRRRQTLPGRQRLRVGQVQERCEDNRNQRRSHGRPVDSIR
jgi:hypothetical protein